MHSFLFGTVQLLVSFWLVVIICINLLTRYVSNKTFISLQAMRRGLLDVVPSSQLEGLTAEDFRLLLNGAGDINVQQLMSYTFFSDETGGT